MCVQVLLALQRNNAPHPNAGIGVLLSHMGKASAFGEVRHSC